MEDANDRGSIEPLRGMFWSPEAPAIRIDGVLRLRANGDELELSTPKLDHDRQQDQIASHPRLFGILENRDKVTIVDAQPTGSWRSSSHTFSADFYQFITLFGAHVENDDITFIDLEFDWLGQWAPGHALTTALGADRIELDTAPERLASISWNDRRLSFDRDVKLRVSADEVVAQSTWRFRIDAPGLLADTAVEWVSPLQDFLMVAVGRRPGFLKLTVWFQDGLHAAARLPWPRQGPSGMALSSPRSLTRTRTLLLPDDGILSLDEALRTWFSILPQVRIIVSMLSTGLAVRDASPEHQFLSLFVALDLLARQGDEIDTKSMTSAEHKERVASITHALEGAALPQGTQDWAREILRSRNSKSQAAFLSEVLILTGLFSGSDGMTTAKRLNDLRTDVAHHGAFKEIERDEIAVEVAHLTELLEWLVRSEIIVRLGVDRSEMRDRLLANSRFREVLERRKYKVL